MASASRIALTGTPERLLACAPELDAVELVPSSQPLSDDTELVIALGAAAGAPEPEAPPTVVWLDAGEQPCFELRACDRLIATDPQTAGAWRTLPLPVADARFMPAPLPAPAPSVRWIGSGSSRREELLRRHTGAATWPAAGGSSPASPSGAVMGLVDVTGGDVAVNLPELGRDWVTHELALALASGCLLVSETLTPALGLERESTTSRRVISTTSSSRPRTRCGARRPTGASSSPAGARPSGCAPRRSWRASPAISGTSWRPRHERAARERADGRLRG